MKVNKVAILLILEEYLIMGFVFVLLMTKNIELPDVKINFYYCNQNEPGPFPGNVFCLIILRLFIIFLSLCFMLLHNCSHICMLLLSVTHCLFRPSTC